MRYRRFALLAITFIGFVMVAGCISQNETTTASFEPVDEVNGFFDLPLSSPPTELMVATSVDKDPIYNTINVRFDGGRGQNVVRSAMARVTLSDGRIEQKELMPRSGNTVSFEGTNGMDVVEVVISYMNGESYKVLSEVVGFIRPNLQRERIKG
jgi:hypothetical protein